MKIVFFFWGKNHLNTLFYKALNGFVKVEAEVIVLMGTQDVMVEISVVIEVAAQVVDVGFPLTLFQRVRLDEFRLEDVFQQVILVLKMIVEGLSVHVMSLTYIFDSNLFQGDFLYQVF